MQPDATGASKVKVKVVANELVDTDIEMVSLVRHGANRAPFKVLKSDDEDDKPTLGDKLQSFFSLKKDEYNVVAYFIRKDAAEAVLPVLKSHGVDIEKAAEKDGVVSVPVSDAPAKGFVQLNDALAVAVDQPLREFSDESIVKAYAEGLGLSDFAPGVSLAVRGLADAVWTLLNPANAADARDDRVAKVDSMLASFRKYVTSLAKALPEQVFRVEAETHDLVKEESPMKGKLSEVVPGDLDGLEKADDAPPADPKVEAEAPAPVAKAEEAAPPAAPAEAPAFTPCGECPNPEACTKNGACAAKAAAMEKSEQDPILKALEALSAQVASIAKAVEEQKTITDSLSAKVEGAPLAKSATPPVETTTVVRKGEDIDLALSSLGGREVSQTRRVEKTGEAVWDGLMSDLNSFRPSR